MTASYQARRTMRGELVKRQNRSEAKDDACKPEDILDSGRIPVIKLRFSNVEALVDAQQAKAKLESERRGNEIT